MRDWAKNIKLQNDANLLHIFGNDDDLRLFLSFINNIKFEYSF